MRVVFRVSFHLLIGLMLIGAVAGVAFAMTDFGGSHLVWDDQVVDGAWSIPVGAAAGVVVGMVVAFLLALLATFIGVIVPVMVVLLVLVLGIVVVVAMASVLGGLAVVFAPVLLLGLACVLLIRGFSRRAIGRPHSMPPT